MSSIIIIDWKYNKEGWLEAKLSNYEITISPIIPKRHLLRVWHYSDEDKSIAESELVLMAKFDLDELEEAKELVADFLLKTNYLSKN
jgi:hypothetical protein